MIQPMHRFALFLLLLSACSSETETDASFDASVSADSSVDGAVTDGQVPDAQVFDGGIETRTVQPARIDDLLTNTTMGFANFHFGWRCNLPPVTYTPAECATRIRNNWPENYPESAVAYFRWHWSDLEPVQGQIDFAMIDATIQSANALGETLSFRVMTIDEGGTGIPDWLANTIAHQWLPADGGNTFWPDYRDTTFQTEHARFVSALGQRYNNHPAVDHFDIGSVGCWGEWNTACLTNGDGLIEVLNPQDDTERDAIVTAYSSLVDHHLTAFPDTPLVMLGIGSSGGRELDVLLHAIRGGAGWRVDCWGDWGIWGGAWSHHDNLYPDLIAHATAAYPAFPDVWQHAPIQLEVCATMPDWHSRGWTTNAPDGRVHKTFAWALDQHASVLNGKFTAIPADYVPAMNEMLKRNGYRFVIDQLTHNRTVKSGEEISFSSSWSNIGVAPTYLPRTLSYRLKGTTSETYASQQDVRTWLPGPFEIVDRFTVGLAAGTYDLEVAILDRAGTEPQTDPLPPTFLGIEGRGAEGWYTLSQIEVVP